LYGWWIPAKNESSDSAPTLILVHGWGRNVERMIPYIQKLHPRDYNLLVFDFRNHGSSDPDKYPNLLKFSEDIRATVDFVVEQVSVEPGRIGVIGLSVGGGAAIHAAAFDNRIKSVVTIGALAHPVDVMRLEFQKRHVPYFPLAWLFLKYLQFKMGINFAHIAPVNNIRDAKANILLIHGEQDVVVPIDQGRQLQNAGNPETTQLWIVPGKGHSDCHDHPEFWKKVESFLQKAVKP
jgi:pimeloyl-ACP methyl ester carboxylesterase